MPIIILIVKEIFVKTYYNICKSLAKIITVLFIVVACSGGVFLVMNQNVSKPSFVVDQTNMNISTVSEPLDIVNSAPKNILTELGAISEFTIPELDIKLILPDGLIGLKYTIDDSAPWGPVAFLTTSSLEKADVDSQCITSGPLGVIWRVPRDPNTVSDSKVSVSKQAGESYVAYQHPQGSCSNNAATTSLQISQIKLLQQTINTIESIK